MFSLLQNNKSQYFSRIEGCLEHISRIMYKTFITIIGIINIMENKFASNVFFGHQDTYIITPIASFMYIYMIIHVSWDIIKSLISPAIASNSVRIVG